MFAAYYEISHFDLLRIGARIAAGALLVLALVVVVLVRILSSGSGQNRRDDDSRDT